MPSESSALGRREREPELSSTDEETKQSVGLPRDKVAGDSDTNTSIKKQKEKKMGKKKEDLTKDWVTTRDKWTLGKTEKDRTNHEQEKKVVEHQLAGVNKEEKERDAKTMGEIPIKPQRKKNISQPTRKTAEKSRQVTTSTKDNVSKYSEERKTTTSQQQAKLPDEEKLPKKGKKCTEGGTVESRFKEILEGGGELITKQDSDGSGSVDAGSFVTAPSSVSHSPITAQSQSKSERVTKTNRHSKDADVVPVDKSGLPSAPAEGRSKGLDRVTFISEGQPKGTKSSTPEEGAAVKKKDEETARLLNRVMKAIQKLEKERPDLVKQVTIEEKHEQTQKPKTIARTKVSGYPSSHL